MMKGVNQLNMIEERNKLIKDLELTFSMALTAQDYKAAIQAKHMIAKMQGFLNPKQKNKEATFSLIELSAQELEAMITEAEDIKKWQKISAD